MIHEPLIHELAWDEARVEAFWNQYAQLPWAQDTYFAFQVGFGVVRLLKKLISLRGKRVLDYGCGPGYLIDFLLAAGARCTGVDVSPASVELANKRFNGHPGWEGAFVARQDLQFPGDPFDLIVSVETIEHLLPERLPEMIHAFRQALLPRRGYLWLSTPHNEHLELAQVFCPECGSTFHRFQHQSAFNSESLSDLLITNGFRTCVTGATDFARFQPPPSSTPLDWSLRMLLKRCLLMLDTMGDALHIHPSRSTGFPTGGRIGHGPHLFWLGSPNSDTSPN